MRRVGSTGCVDDLLDVPLKIFTDVLRTLRLWLEMGGI